jgi:hypothetical protein
MHPLRKLRNANTVANSHVYCWTFIKNKTVNGAASNAYLTTSYVPVETKCIIMKYKLIMRWSRFFGVAGWAIEGGWENLSSTATH